MIGVAAVALLGVAAVLMRGGSPVAPTDDICAVFESRPDWYDQTLAAERRWGADAPLMLAIVWRESKFVADARPPRRRILGFLPGRHLSSAYGYAQAIDGTWDWYQQDTERFEGRRDSFADAIDFVGWYLERSRQMLGLRLDQSMDHYLAYHQGHGGYRDGAWRQSDALMGAARDMAFMRRQYERQLSACVPDFAARQAPDAVPFPQADPRRDPGRRLSPFHLRSAVAG